jgi:hypothetical protein
MKTIKHLFFILITMLPIVLMASVTVSKTTVKIVRNTPSSFFERYSLSDESTNGIDICTKAVSAQGTFNAPSGALLGTVSKMLLVQLKGTGTNPRVGSINESVRIPYSVLKRAEKLGLTTFRYNRTFAFQGACTVNSIPPLINIKVAGSSSVALHVSRIQLYFANGRADIAADKNQKLPLSVDLKLYGKGFLKGYWEVDGRILSRVYKQINHGSNLTLRVPKIPGLPTYETGTHRVRFVITSPEPSISLPQAIYFVKEQPSVVSATIKLLKPKNGSALDGDAWEFAWSPILKTDTYLIEFSKKGEKKPVFSALSKSPAYTIPNYVTKKIFNAKTTYSWKVTGYNSFSNQIGISEIRDFTIK